MHCGSLPFFGGTHLQKRGPIWIFSYCNFVPQFLDLPKGKKSHVGGADYVAALLPDQA